MNTTNLIPMIITDKLAETRAFYLDRLGFEITHDQPNYLQVHFGAGPELAFMAHAAEGPLKGPFMKPFDGAGLLVSIPAADPDALCAAVRDRGVKVASEPTDRPWGWRSFITTDPNGIALDFFKVLPGGAPAQG